MIITQTAEIQGVHYPTLAESLMPEARWTELAANSWYERTSAYYGQLYSQDLQLDVTYDFTGDCFDAAMATFDEATDLLLRSYEVEPASGLVTAQMVLDAFFENADEAFISNGGAEQLLSGLVAQARCALRLAEPRAHRSYAEAVVMDVSGVGDWVSDPVDYFGDGYSTVRTRFEGSGDRVIDQGHTTHTMNWVYGDNGQDVNQGELI